MATLEWSTKALDDLGRLQAFLHDKSPRAASAALDAILDAAGDLQSFPLIGRPLAEDAAEYRELLIRFSNSGYVLLYRLTGDLVEVQAIRHMREVGY